MKALGLDKDSRLRDVLSDLDQAERGEGRVSNEALRQNQDRISEGRESGEKSTGRPLRRSEETRGGGGELRRSGDTARSGGSRGSQGSQHSRGSQGSSGKRASSRAGLARIVNAAASAVEEYLDASTDEDAPSVPKDDRYEAVRRRQRAVETFADKAAPTASGSIPGVTESSTERFNEIERPPRNQSLSPFASQAAQARQPSPEQRPSPERPPQRPKERRMLKGGGLATMERRGMSLEVPGSMAGGSGTLPSSAEIRAQIGRPPPHRMSLSSDFGPRSGPRQSVDIAQGRLNSYALAQAARSPMASSGSHNLGQVEETRDVGGKLLRRRVALPWQITASFGCVTILGCLVGMTTLGIAIRNVIYLNGPRAGPQLPDIKRQLDLVIQILNQSPSQGADMGG